VALGFRATGVDRNIEDERIMKRYLLPLLVIVMVAASGGTKAASTSSISATISFTLTDILVGGISATEFVDYEPDGGVDVYSAFNEDFLFGGTGSTTGVSFSSVNGTTVDPDVGADPLQIGDTLTMSLDSEATANTGYVNRNQIEFAGFSIYNYTDDGFGNADTLSFVFDYTVTYTTSLSNDVAGDQALVNLFSVIELDQDSGVTSIDLFPQGSLDAISEVYFGAGTVTPGDTLSDTFTLDLADSYGYFTFETTATTPTNINTVPLPAPLWCFGSGLLGLFGIARRKKNRA
jgi:hypothetical protein